MMKIILLAAIPLVTLACCPPKQWRGIAFADYNTQREHIEVREQVNGNDMIHEDFYDIASLKVHFNGLKVCHLSRVFVCSNCLHACRLYEILKSKDLSIM